MQHVDRRFEIQDLAIPSWEACLGIDRNALVPIAPGQRHDRVAIVCSQLGTGLWRLRGNWNELSCGGVEPSLAIGLQLDPEAPFVQLPVVKAAEKE